MTEENTPTTAPAEAASAATATAAAPTAAPAKERSNDTPRGRGRRGNRPRPPKEKKEFEEAILNISRVTRVVKGGRRMRFLVVVVIGDKKGRVGFGTGKSVEVLGAIQKAVANAKKQLVKVPIVNGTIPHEVHAKFKASKVMLLPAPEGKGIIAGGAVRKILELAGYHNVLAKAHGSRTGINLASATFQALADLKNVKVEEKKEEKPAEETAKPKKETKKAAAPKKASAKKSAEKSDK